MTPEEAQAGPLSAGARRIIDPRFSQPVAGGSTRKGVLTDLEGMETTVDPRLMNIGRSEALYDYEGSPYILTQSDRSAAGGVVTSVKGKEIDPVNLRGGRDFMFDPQSGDLVWASDPAVVKSMYKRALELRKLYGKDPLLLPYTMAPTGIDFATMPLDVMINYARQGMGRSDIKRLDEQIRKVIPSWKGVMNPEANAVFREVHGNKRKAVANIIDKNFRDVEGGLSMGEARAATSDAAQYMAPDGSIQNIGQIEISDSSSMDQLSDHPTYRGGLKGQGIGKLDVDIDARELMEDKGRELTGDAADIRALSMNHELSQGVVDEKLLRRLYDKQRPRIEAISKKFGVSIPIAAMALMGEPEEAQAGPISSGRNAAAELARRAAAGDIRAQRAIQGGYNTEAYTGTTYSDIREFDARKANPEGDWGRGVYASTSPADVSENYAGVGPDLTNRISQESERVADELADYPDDLLEEYGFTLDDYEADEAGVAEKIAAQRLVGDVEQGVIYPLQIDTRKYAQIGGKEPTVLRQPDYYARAEANLDLDDYDSIDDYEDAVREQAESYAMDDPESLYNKIREAVRNTDGYQDDMAIESVLEELTNDIVDGEVRVMDIDQAIRNNFNNVYDDNGDLVSSGGVSAQALENLGFEGVIDNTVNEKFGTGRRYGGAMAGVNADTSHIITFPKAENRIRSRFAQFDPDKVNSRDILAGVGGGAVLAGTMTPEEAQSSQAGMGGMGVRSASTAEDEEAMLAAQPPAPTGGDLLRQANDEFMGGVLTGPGSFFNPETYYDIADVGRGIANTATGFLGDMEQMIVGGIIQGVGGATTWEDALRMIGGGLGQQAILAPEGRASRFVEGMQNYNPVFVTSEEVGQVPGIISSSDQERSKRFQALGGFLSPI
jgi:hypothetical protein